MLVSPSHWAVIELAGAASPKDGGDEPSDDDESDDDSKRADDDGDGDKADD